MKQSPITNVTKEQSKKRSLILIAICFAIYLAGNLILLISSGSVNWIQFLIITVLLLVGLAGLLIDLPIHLSNFVSSALFVIICAVFAITTGWRDFPSWTRCFLPLFGQIAVLAAWYGAVYKYSE